SPKDVAPAVSKGAGQRVGECSRVIPAVLVGIGPNRVDTGIAVETGSIGNEIRASGIPCGRVDHAAALQYDDGAQLPATHHLVYEASMVEKSLASTKWQSVEDGSSETLRNVEIG